MSETNHNGNGITEIQDMPQEVISAIEGETKSIPSKLDNRLKKNYLRLK
jgi:hypothetical protein